MAVSAVGAYFFIFFLFFLFVCFFPQMRFLAAGSSYALIFKRVDVS